MQGLDMPIAGMPLKKKRGRKPKNYQPQFDEQIVQPVNSKLNSQIEFEFIVMLLIAKFNNSFNLNSFGKKSSDTECTSITRAQSRIARLV